MVGPFHDTIDFLVNDTGSLLTVFTRASCQRGTRKWIIALAIRDRPEALAHTPARNHLACDGRDTLQIVFRPGRDVPDRHLLASTTTKASDRLRVQARCRAVRTVLEGRR